MYIYLCIVKYHLKILLYANYSAKLLTPIPKYTHKHKSILRGKFPAQGELYYAQLHIHIDSLTLRFVNS